MISSEIAEWTEDTNWIRNPNARLISVVLNSGGATGGLSLLKRGPLVCMSLGKQTKLLGNVVTVIVFQILLI